MFRPAHFTTASMKFPTAFELPSAKLGRRQQISTFII